MIIKKNKITPAESEICNIFLEECAEAIQAMSKIFRFGWNSCHPDVPNYTNREHLTEETGDLLCMIKLMIDKGMLNADSLERAANHKLEKLKKYSDIKL